MKTLFNQQYSADFTEKCRKALEASFGEIPMPKFFSKRKENVKVEPVFMIELITKTKPIAKTKPVKKK